MVVRSGKERVFCAGANIRMLGTSSHAHKVAFCKFTNETRCAIEDASAQSGQRYLSAINATAAGGGYELALATDWILLVDDGTSAVSLPEVPLLGVLPGTGGLVRVIDKRKVRRDRADFFATTEEGVRGARAREWGLVDEIVPSSRFESAVAERARSLAAFSDRPTDAPGIRLDELARPRRPRPHPSMHTSMPRSIAMTAHAGFECGDRPARRLRTSTDSWTRATRSGLSRPLASSRI